MLRQLRNERVLILGAYRETELDRAHPLAKSLVDWNRERLITRIALRRFNESETGDQLGALLGEQVSGEFAVAVHRETEGNPFFVEEVLKALIERGSVRRESGRWRRCDMDELLIPQSVKEAIGNRLDRVSQNTNEVLRVSAILGKVFTFEDLSAASEQDEDTLLDALDEASNAQLIAAGSGDSFSFTHDKIREVLYEELNPIRRRRLHRHVAEGLERNRKTICCTVEKLAHHYIQAGDHQRGLEYAKQAAAEAARVFAFDEAIAAYGRARDCAEALGLTEEQLAQEEAIGKAFMLHGDTILAAEHFERALELATDPTTRVRLQSQAAASLVTTGDPRGSEYLREVLQVLDPVTNPLETANALSTEARFHHLAGRHKKAIELLMRAVELVSPIAESDHVSPFEATVISQIYPYTAGGYQHYGLYDESDHWARRAIAFGEKHNILFAQASGIEFLGENCIHKGTYKAGLEYAEREIEIANKLHSRERRAWTHYYEAQCRLFLGETQRAEQEFLEGIALAEAIGENRVLGLFRSSLGVVQAIQGRYDEALRTVEDNFKRSSPSLLYSHFEALRCFAEVRFRRGEIEEAEQLCRQAEELVTPTESRVSRLWLGPLYIEVLLAGQKRDEAATRLADYQTLVADCQSPRFSSEATHLATLIN
jgi:tetratricopeptide (TPR) repeat protein